MRVQPCDQVLEGGVIGLVASNAPRRTAFDSLPAERLARSACHRKVWTLHALRVTQAARMDEAIPSIQLVIQGLEVVAQLGEVLLDHVKALLLEIRGAQRPHLEAKAQQLQGQETLIRKSTNMNIYKNA